MNGLPVPSPQKLPRWRGFNLTEKYRVDANKILQGNDPYKEQDFQWIHQWGFNFVRIPIDYNFFFKQKQDVDRFTLKELDQAINWGQKYNIHVNLCLHRVPGYCVNDPDKLKPGTLWNNQKEQFQLRSYWSFFASHYQNISNKYLSFNLINEPPYEKTVPFQAPIFSGEIYAKVVKMLVNAIRAKDPDRLIIADGIRNGIEPVPEIADLGIAQSTRGYNPFYLSHYQANWASYATATTPPIWPQITPNEDGMDQDDLLKKRVLPWQELEKKFKIGIHIGEWGAYNKTPHDVVLRWMDDVLMNWEKADWGWALWHFRGDFGIIDSRRNDVQYEQFDYNQIMRRSLPSIKPETHNLDVEMLHLLQRY